MEGVLVVEEGARTPLGHLPGTFEQDKEPPNAHIGPCNELLTLSGVDPGFAPTMTPNGLKWL